MKTQKLSLKNIAKLMSIAMLGLVLITISCTKDVTNDSTEAFSNPESKSTAFKIVTPTATKGGLIQIKGNVGNSKKDVSILLAGQKLPIIAFLANENVTVKLPENANSSTIEISLKKNEPVSLGMLNVFEKIVPPVYWIENTATGTVIMKGHRALFSNVAEKEKLVKSTNQIVSISNSLLTGELFYVEQEYDNTTFQATSKIIKYNLFNKSKTTILSASGAINTIAVSALTSEVFYSITNNTTYTATIKKAKLNGSEVKTVLDLGSSDFNTEMAYNFKSKSLYYIKNLKSVIKLSLKDKNTTTIYDSNNFRTIGGLGVSKLGNQLFVSDLGSTTSQSDIIYKGNIDGSAQLAKVLTQSNSNNSVYNTKSLDYTFFGYVYWFNSSTNKENNNGSIYRAKASANPLNPELVFDSISAGNQIDAFGKTRKNNTDNVKLSL